MEEEIMPDPPAPDSTPAAPAPDESACAGVARMGEIDIQPRLGNGVELFVRLEGADGETLEPGQHLHCLRLRQPDGPAVAGEHIRTTRPADGALTAVLVAPSRSADSAAQARAMVESFLAARPADERIAIFRWGADVHQVANFTTDQSVALRLAARGLVHADEALLPVDQAVTAVQRDLEALSAEAFRGVRSIVVVAPEQSLHALPEVPPRVVALWALGPDTSLTGNNIVIADGEESAAALAGVLDEHIAAGLAHLAWCGSGRPDTVRVEARDSAAAVAVRTPVPLREERHMQCSTEALARPRAYPERVELVFATEEQRETYRRRVADRSKDKFELMLRLWDGGALVEAKAKLRGSSSIRCERKNYNIDIRGPEPRRFMSGSATDEIFLISMCLDDHYLNQHTGNTLATRLGFFPLKTRFIELVVDGEHRGIYLLIEKPKDELLRDNGRVRSILRRGTDIKGHRPKVEYSHGSEREARDEYQTLMDRIVRATGSELLDVVEQGMDIDQYLRWIALMTLLGNGDYIDEVSFIATQTIDGLLEPTSFYSIVSWDLDDLFSSCHRDGDYAIHDPYGMLYCTEAVIDHAMFADTDLYTRYVGVLDSVLDEISLDVFATALDETVALLDAYFQKEEIRQAMIEIHPRERDTVPSYDEVMGAVAEAATTKRREFADRHGRLRQAVATWREDHPHSGAEESAR